MKVSFIVVSYNQEKYIDEALDGCFSQDYSNIEFIIADDRSTDKTFDRIQSYIEKHNLHSKVLAYQNPQNLGVVKNLNTAIEKSSGDILICIGGDDVALPHHASSVVSAFKTHNVSLVAANSLIMNEAGQLGGQLYAANHKAFDLRETIHRGHANVAGAGSAWSRELFDVFGPMPTGIQNEDQNIPFRANLLRGISINYTPCLKYRLHDKSLSSWLWRENSLTQYVENYYGNFPNLISHYRNWAEMYDMHGAKDPALRRKIQQRIDFYQKALELRDASVFMRLIKLSPYFQHIWWREWVEATGGRFSLGTIRAARILRNKLRALKAGSS